MHSPSAAGCKTARVLGLRCFEEMTSGMGSGETRPRDERNGDGPWRKCGKRPDEKRDSAAAGGSTFKRRPTTSIHYLPPQSHFKPPPTNVAKGTKLSILKSSGADIAFADGPDDRPLFAGGQEGRVMGSGVSGGNIRPNISQRPRPHAEHLSTEQ